MLPLTAVAPSGPLKAKQTTLSFVTSTATPKQSSDSTTVPRSGGAQTNASKAPARLIRVEMPTPIDHRPVRPETYDPDAALHRFGITAFRAQQREAVTSILSGRDVVVILPTGAGKSLCYQLPATLLKGVTIVVSPLIALMQDQVDSLIRKGIPASRVWSAMPVADRRKILADLHNKEPSVKLLYVTPELLSSDWFLSVLQTLFEHRRLSLFAIDEAHCISSWGHDFRPAYRKLESIRTHFPGVPILAATATATKAVRDDILSSLALKSPAIFETTFDRPNLSFQVVYADQLDSPLAHLVEFLQTFPPSSPTIIYAHTRESCVGLAKDLEINRISATVYHAGMRPVERVKAQSDWTSGKVQVMVATVAFGMGIDKRDVRIVIHWCLPKSVEGYYQEAGRAGRDGKPSVCRLYYSRADYRRLAFVTQGQGGPSAEAGLASLKSVADLCERAQCRRVAILKYFGEDAKFTRCASQPCDFCKDPEGVAKGAEACRNGVPPVGRRSAAPKVSDPWQTAQELAEKDVIQDAVSDDEDDEDTRERRKKKRARYGVKHCEEDDCWDEDGCYGGDGGSSRGVLTQYQGSRDDVLAQLEAEEAAEMAASQHKASFTARAFAKLRSAPTVVSSASAAAPLSRTGFTKASAVVATASPGLAKSPVGRKPASAVGAPSLTSPYQDVKARMAARVPTQSQPSPEALADWSVTPPSGQPLRKDASIR